MTVQELIKKLEKMPLQSNVEFFGGHNHFYETYGVVYYDENTVVISETEKKHILID